MAASKNGVTQTPLSLALAHKDYKGYAAAAKEAGLINDKGVPNKPSLWDVALASKDAETFESVARVGGHTVASFSANGPWDWYYKAVQQYIDTHMGGEDDGSTYVVLAAIGQYTGMTQEEVDAFLTERRAVMGAGASDRLAKAREKAQAEGKRKDTIIQVLMKQLNLTQEQVDAMAEAEA